MFLGVGGPEKGLVIDTESNVHCAVIAAVQVRRKAAIFRTQDIYKKTFFWQPFHLLTHLYPINPFYHVLLPPHTTGPTNTFTQIFQISFQARFCLVLKRSCQ